MHFDRAAMSPADMPPAPLTHLLSFHSHPSMAPAVVQDVSLIYPADSMATAHISMLAGRQVPGTVMPVTWVKLYQYLQSASAAHFVAALSSTMPLISIVHFITAAMSPGDMPPALLTHGKSEGKVRVRGGQREGVCRGA